MIGVKGYYRMRKAELIETTNLGEPPRPIRITREYFKQNPTDTKLTSCRPWKKCEHRRNRYTCKECGGGGVCEHYKQRYHCKECRGAGICEHDKQKYVCKECKGICFHDVSLNSCNKCNRQK